MINYTYKQLGAFTLKELKVIIHSIGFEIRECKKWEQTKLERLRYGLKKVNRVVNNKEKSKKHIQLKFPWYE